MPPPQTICVVFTGIMVAFNRKTRQLLKEQLALHPGNQTLQAFFEETDYELECSKICGRTFDSPGDHTDFLKQGGCQKLIRVLANTEKSTQVRTEAD